MQSFSEEYASKADPAAAFQNFVADLFGPEHPGLVVYPAEGRDGAIDLFDPNQGVVFECKFIGDRGFNPANRRWQETRGHLEKHLTAQGPGQSQYAPWYSATPPISAYRFCISHELENESCRQKLEQAIRDFFSAQAKVCADLNHLATIRVEVWCWDRLKPKLDGRQDLILRWFDKQTPLGLKLLHANEALRNNFRDYLNPQRLPFCELPELALPGILAKLDNEIVGLVLHGRGGIGKTRLMREVGLHALTQGWVVYFINTDTFKSAMSASLDALVQRAPGAQILLLLDYLERLPAFEELAGLIDEYNSDGAHLRLLATCRDSYFSNLSLETLGEVGLDEVDLGAVTEHILRPVPNAESLRTVCGDIPIFAVFVRYLHEKNQADSLQELLGDRDFKLWWSKRLPPYATKSSGDARPATRLLAAYPCRDQSLDELGGRCREATDLHRDLSRDGWVFQDHDDALWTLAHDLLADQTLLDELNHQTTRSRALRHMLKDATACRFQESLVRSLQRIAARFCRKRLG